MSHLTREDNMNYKYHFSSDTWMRDFEENIVSTWLNELKTNGKILIDDVFFNKNKKYYLILKNFKKQIGVVAQ